MSSELVPATPPTVDQLADERELLRRRAEGYAVRWLHGYTNHRTRNGYARDIGLSSEVFAALPGAPHHPAEPGSGSWIEWALDHGIDPCGALRKADAEGYAHSLAGLPKKTRQRRWAALCAYYKSLRVEGVTTSNPNELVNRRTMGLAGTAPSATLPLHPRQVQALHLAARLPERGPEKRNRERNRAMFAVLSATGCRAAELVDINLDGYKRQVEGHALIRLRGKGGKERWVMLPSADAELVAAYLEVRRAPTASTAVTLSGQVSAAPDSPLFTSERGHRLHVNTVTKMLQSLARRPSPTDPRPEVREAARVLADLAKAHPHQLRHTYAVVAEEAGVPVSQLQADLGHSSLTTTQGYLHAADRAERSAARVVSSIYHNDPMKGRA